MFKEDFQAGEQALQLYELTYSPAHTPSGTPHNPAASRQVLQERRTAQIEAPHADAAVWRFERDQGCMVTACKRVQEGDWE